MHFYWASPADWEWLRYGHHVRLIDKATACKRTHQLAGVHRMPHRRHSADGVEESLDCYCCCYRSLLASVVLLLLLLLSLRWWWQRWRNKSWTALRWCNTARRFAFARHMAGEAPQQWAQLKAGIPGSLSLSLSFNSLSRPSLFLTVSRVLSLAIAHALAWSLSLSLCPSSFQQLWQETIKSIAYFSVLAKSWWISCSAQQYSTRSTATGRPGQAGRQVGRRDWFCIRAWIQSRCLSSAAPVTQLSWACFPAGHSQKAGWLLRPHTLLAIDFCLALTSVFRLLVLCLSQCQHD